MIYKDLIQFEAIESNIVLTEANNSQKAKNLVRTFITSKLMEDNLSKIIIPNLQFEVPKDQKGLFIVGNYGTGKSHLMAFISAIAENRDYLDLVENGNIKTEAERIAGKFKVIRSELGGVSSTLRNAICMELEKHLKQLGINFKFPSTDQISNNKDSLHEMMALFQEKYPKKGLVFILDELLDFLRGREDDQKLIQDLSFLREIGEICKNSRFRFITGVQESLFESSSFKFAASSLGRVSERFVQATIQKEDIRYVVSKRLLNKTDVQKAKIREHLTEFQGLYRPLTGGLENYVELFPVHEQYFEKFQMVNIGEQRRILESISKKIETILELEVPEKETGIFSYESYWQNVKDDHTNRANPDVRKVVEISDRIENILNESFEGSKEHLAVAQKIISALAIHRLTTGDLKAAVGLTAENLKDELFLILSVPEKNEDFLLKIIQKILKTIMSTLNSLYIRLNEENRHYYFYADEGVDPDQEIKDKAAKLSPGELGRYYFDILSVMMEQSDSTTYRSDFNIWEYQLMWFQRKTEVEGYLFFGSPNERSTTQPPREFYIYFTDPFKAGPSIPSGKDDEVFIRLKDRDEFFEENLRNYAAAKELALNAVQQYKTVYSQIGQKYQKKVQTWMREKISTCFQISYMKNTKLFQTWSGNINLRALSDISGSETLTFKQQIDTLSSGLLTDYFSDKKPDYPTFTIKITKQNRRQTVLEALRSIVKDQYTGQAKAILTSLDLMSTEGISIEHSSYCNKIISLLNAKGNGQVLNRNEIIYQKYEIEYIIDTQLEAEFLPVFLAALVNEGAINISIGSDRITASNLEKLNTISYSNIIDFSHIKKAEDFPLAELKALFTTLGLRPGLIVNSGSRNEAVKGMIAKADELIKECTHAEQKLKSGFFVWESRLLSETKTQEVLQTLSVIKDFLETISRYNTPAKIANFKHNLQDIEKINNNLNLIADIKTMELFTADFQYITTYLDRAEIDISNDSDWKKDYRSIRSEFFNAITKDEPWVSGSETLKKKLTDLKERYKKEYIESHKHYRLGARGSENQAKLKSDKRLECLQKLSTIEILPSNQLRIWEEKLNKLQNCTLLTMDDLERIPKCPHCNFERKLIVGNNQNAEQQLISLDSELDNLIENWASTLRDNLKDPVILSNIDLIIDKKSVDALQSFISGEELPKEISLDLLKTIKDVLKGLEKVIITKKNLIAYLEQSGVPVTPNELRARFEEYLTGLIAGREEEQLRIVIED